MEATRFRFGFAAILGKPNVGKSSLINRLAGTKIAITSRRRQTTRRPTLGIVNRQNFQLVLIDTPGIHRSNQMLNIKMTGMARNSLARCDVTIMVIDSRGWTTGDDFVWDTIQHHRSPLILLMNKIDLVRNHNTLLPLIEQCNNRGHIQEIIPVSSKTGHNVSRLPQIIYPYLPESPPGFPISQTRVSNIEFSVAELVREQVFRLVGAEIPYHSAVIVDSKPQRENMIPQFHADIWVESTGQRAILIGVNGERLKQIGIRARHEIEKLLGTKAILTTHVKVRRGWSTDPTEILKLGYGD